jgi:hypothetical protein
LHKELPNPITSMNTNESTYALIVRSEAEEKGRGVLETVLYAAFILSAVFSIWQFARQPVTVPARGLEPCVACSSQSAQADLQS